VAYALVLHQDLQAAFRSYQMYPTDSFVHIVMSRQDVHETVSCWDTGIGGYESSMIHYLGNPIVNVLGGFVTPILFRRGRAAGVGMSYG
jgi:hypothetical protein